MKNIERGDFLFENSAPLEYYSYGKPEVLLVSGAHGDEWKTILPVFQNIIEHADKMPGFVFIPRLSPSAVAVKKRQAHQDGLRFDLNRVFYPGTPYREAQVAKLFLRQFPPFRICLYFHEDFERSRRMYLYDTDDNGHDEQINAFKKDILRIGVGLYDGLDDGDDPNLQNHVQEGYVTTAYRNTPPHAGYFEDWLIRNGIARRVITPELPMHLSLHIKKQVVHTIFHHFVLNQ